jgi:predicted amidophosphoribosyltransferase
MIQFATDQLLQLAKIKFDSGDHSGALHILKGASQSPEVARLSHEVRYSYGKDLVARGNYAEADEQFKACTLGTVPLEIRVLAHERCALLNAIFKGESTPISRVTGVHAGARIQTATDLDFRFLAPEVWFVGSAAAYRSGYDKQWHDNLSRLIRMVKHEAQPETLRRLGELLADFMYTCCTPILSRADYLVPVPTSPDRWNERGYAIPTALATTVSKMCAIPCYEEVLEVAGDVPELRRVPRWFRARAIEGAYAAKKKPWVEGRSLVIVDDIITTGSTIKEIARTLADAGAAEVAAISLAHTERS